MLSLITRTETYKSGTILEVCDGGGEDRCREAELLNDPGPCGPASKTSNKGKAVEDTLHILGVEETALGNSQGVNNE
jgi:hypothetical protein